MRLEAMRGSTMLCTAALGAVFLGCGSSSDARTSDDSSDVSDEVTTDAPPSDAPGDVRDALDAADAMDANDAVADAPPPVCTGDACVHAGASCRTGGPPAQFVSETPVPSIMAPWSSLAVGITFANCGTEAWTTAARFALGAQRPQDNPSWGTTRVALPASVPVGSAVTVPFTIYAPPTTGKHGYSWAIVHEGVAWLAEDSPAHDIDVEPSSATVTLCAGVTADASGTKGASAALQSCIDATPTGGTLEIPASILRIDAQITITRAITLRTQGTSGAVEGCVAPGFRCAVLRAAPELDAVLGMLHMKGDHVVLDHLVLDGNRGDRLASHAATVCASGSNGRGYNGAMDLCANCAITHSLSTRALCGTGMQWVGDDGIVTDSVFSDNGDHATSNMWSDGLTLNLSNRAVVQRCTFRDNSDISFISGGARDGVFTDNHVLQERQAAFGGIMLDNFNGGTTGDFTGAKLANNDVNCTAHQCDFGIELGPHPWYPSPNIFGATITANSVTGAKVNINVYGGGTVAAPLAIFANDVSGATPGAPFSCGSFGSNFNIAPDSHVDRHGETSPVTTFSVGCP